MDRGVGSVASGEGQWQGGGGGRRGEGQRVAARKSGRGRGNRPAAQSGSGEVCRISWRTSLEKG